MQRLTRRAGSSSISGDGPTAAAPLHGRPPHPGWQPPQPQPAPFDSDTMHTVDPSQLPADVLYPLMISAVVPRPIGEGGGALSLVVLPSSLPTSMADAPALACPHAQP